MNKLFAVLLLTASPAFAQEPAWKDVQKTCSEEYKAAKGEGRQPWAAFLTDCKTRKGFTAKTKVKSAVDFVRVPDKAAATQ